MKEEKQDISKREIIVSAVSKKNNSIKSLDEIWYNINPNLSEDFKKSAIDMIGKINSGDTIELTADFQKRLFNTIVLKKKSEKKNWAEEMTNMESLLNAAHNKLKHFSIRTEKIEIDLEKKYALFKSTLKCSIGEFEAHGDVTADNIDSEKVQKHWIRMAESRAIVRVLRFATNDTRCAEEETEQGTDSLEEK